VQLVRNVVRHQEDSRSDDAAHQQHQRVEQGEPPDQLRLGGRSRRSAHPMPSSSADSSGVPHTRQINAEQSPHTSGSATSRAHVGQ
jgi:hypothetical protein